MADGPPIHDTLYGLPADEFVAARDRLVAELRGRGEREAATEVKALRRPSVTAAALNRVLRARPADLDALLERARELTEGQRKAMAGRAVDVRALQAAHRSAVGAVADRAERDRDVIALLLEVTSLDGDAHDDLRAARFTEPPPPTPGFDLLTPLATVSSLDDARSARRSPGERPRDRRRIGRRRPAPIPEDGPSPDAPPAHEPPVDGDTLGEPAAAEPPTGDEPCTTGGPVGGDTIGQPAADEPPTGDEGVTPRRRGERPGSRRLRRPGPSLALADRRLAAARSAEDKAVERVAELERRLVDARRHLEATRERVASAAAARQRAEHELGDGAE
ncbi:MAG: hypothetical protein ACFCVK_06995 [Acidimicrobiales bacterium]